MNHELDELAPVVEWEDFENYVFDWQQGEHVGLVGPTGQGKSTLTYALLPKRNYVAYFATKPDDPTLVKFGKKHGYERIEEWPETKKGFSVKKKVDAEKMPKRLLWPDARHITAIANQQKQFNKAFTDIYQAGGWTVVFDEFWYMCTVLKMELQSRILLQQARANNISFVMGSQRPSRIPVEVWDQSTHLFMFRDNDEVNLKKMSGIGWLAAGPIRELVANLDPYQFLYINTRKGWMYRSTCPAE